jgi:hypothetical protein
MLFGIIDCAICLNFADAGHNNQLIAQKQPHSGLLIRLSVNLSNHKPDLHGQEFPYSKSPSTSSHSIPHAVVLFILALSSAPLNELNSASLAFFGTQNAHPKNYFVQLNPALSQAVQ